MNMLPFSATVVVVSAGVLGLLIGSFLNVVIYRVPAGKSLLLSSSCPNRDAAVRPWRNVPILSWFALRGKCASCRSPISLRYPLVELGTALFFAGITWWLINAEAESAWALAALLFLAAVSIALALIDIDTFRLPNVIVLPSILVVAVLLAIGAIGQGDATQFIRAVIGSLVLTGFYGLMWVAWPGGMGFGDVKLAALLGLVLGWIGWGAFIVGAFAAFVCGGVFGLLLLAMQRAERKSRIPFGPWMLLGAWIGIFAGEPIANWYLSTFFVV